MEAVLFTELGARTKLGMLRHYAFFTVGLCACNPSNTQDACNDIAHAWCAHIFDLSNQGCGSATDFLAARSYVSLNDCASDVRVFGAFTCATTSTSACEPDDYNGGRATGCASDVSKLPCDYDWSQGPTPASADCGHICCVHTGNLGSGIECCSGTSHIETVGGCMSATPESICD